MYYSYTQNADKIERPSQRPIFQYSDSGTVDPFALFKAVQDRRPQYVPMYNGQR